MFHTFLEWELKFYIPLFLNWEEESTVDRCNKFHKTIFCIDKTTITFEDNDIDFDDCNISEVIKFLQQLVKSPSASAMNKAFTQHITNALMQVREEKLKLKASIPRKVEDGWEPIIKMKVENFDCNVLCDLGASISVMPRKIYDMLDLPPLEQCYLDVHSFDTARKKPLGRVNDVLIMVNNNLVLVYFVVLDIECNAVIDMREGNIKYEFPLKKGMEHFPRKKMKYSNITSVKTNYDFGFSGLDNT